MPSLFPELLNKSYTQYPNHIAIKHKDQSLTYQQLKDKVSAYTQHLNQFNIKPGQRIAVYDAKTALTIVSFIAISSLGAIFVPINPLLKKKQVLHILSDCQVRILITSDSRYQLMTNELKQLALLKHVILSDKENFDEQANISNQRLNSVNENDIAAIFYTSGSTGNAKGVCVTHKNLVAGTKLVTDYCQNSHDDKILALLSFSFDYGFNQICSAFYTGATLVLFDYLLPQDIIKAIEREKITAIAGVPSLWVQLSKINTTTEQTKTLRYITNSGGKFPTPIIEVIRKKYPKVKIYLMYGLTEAFRSSFLNPDLIDQYPESIGKALDGEELYIINEEGKPCATGEIGQLIHRGALVSKGYWNKPEQNQLLLRELDPNYFPISPFLAVYSGDLAKQDENGLFYFVNRKDNMIKTSGNRVSPTEVEETCYSYPEINEAIIIAVPHPELGEAIILVCTTTSDYDEKELKRTYLSTLPNYMHPKKIIILSQLLKSVNGKVDRKLLIKQYKTLFNGNV